ncbi:DDHD domain-containing protein [Pyronema omphalodes]|nr:DDHD domain-containing protein [Pyronema omphalodes]
MSTPATTASAPTASAASTSSQPTPSRSTTPRPKNPTPTPQPTNDHHLSFRHRLSQREYPPDCPPLAVRWYYAVDVPKRKPFQSNNASSAPPPKPIKLPTKFVPFGLRDSRAIEAAFQKLSDEEEAAESQKYKRASAIDLYNEEATKPEEKEVRVPVNEDYLFDVDVKKRELMPMYWEGPVYDVRRGTWFYQEGSTIRPCDENLATQIEEGFLNLKPFRIGRAEPATPKSTTPAPTDASKKDSDTPRPTSSKGNTPAPTTQQQLTWRLFGAHIGSFVVFTDANTAWLFTDDLYGKLTAMTWHMITAGNHPGGVKIVRGYSEQKAPEKAAAVRPQTPPEKSEKLSINPFDSKFKRKSAPPPPRAPVVEEEFVHRKSRDSGRVALERKMSTYGDTETEAQAKMMESEIKEDYNDDDEVDDPAREIEHLLLVTHGIGQKLSMKMESINFIHDVNVFRKSLKGVYSLSPDLQVLNGEDTDVKRKNCRIQCLPVCWRHLLDFPKQSLRQSRQGEQDLAAEEEEEEYPSLEDITVEGVPYVRNLMTDLALDVLLYQSGTYREHIIRTVLSESNRIYALFKKRNPSFKGKVSLVGHSLGSAIMFDILCRQPDENPLFPRKQNELPPLDFPVENFFCLGSPVGLFQMLKGKNIVARPPYTSSSADIPMSPLDDSNSLFEGATGHGASSTAPAYSASGAMVYPFPISSPKCDQLFNIFHPADPIAYRLEPLVSKAMATLKPQPLPYTKRGLLSGQIVGGISGIGQSVTRSVSSMWSSFSSGIATSILNRSLGITDTPSSATSASVSRTNSGLQEGQHPPTLVDAEIETLYTGFQRRRKDLGDKSASASASTEEQEAIGKEERKLKREDEKVRGLNRTGRIDFSIQEGTFDVSLITSIASHLSYWGDDDVNHFVVSQLLSKSRVIKKNRDTQGKFNVGEGWSIGEAMNRP